MVRCFDNKRFLHGLCTLISVSSIISYNTILSWNIFRVKKVTKMSEKVAVGILTGVVTVSEIVTSSIVNSKVGKKFFSLWPGEIVLASLDGFSKSFISNSLFFFPPQFGNSLPA